MLTGMWYDIIELNTYSIVNKSVVIILKYEKWFFLL